ncbi:hypothetical protein HSBAA_PA_0540 (plasmid) [Vreelandella sulfidaeris]|uniref:Uncharacterized protein n=1 Tax=Vreelandella sulfidaeris TaxID=115553 RepID=A0A455UL68_9GAMM|nr:hypothetical protein HSBAA_PA_0540 [Halomonas sulfidaeris]
MLERIGDPWAVASQLLSYLAAGVVLPHVTLTTRPLGVRLLSVRRAFWRWANSETIDKPNPLPVVPWPESPKALSDVIQKCLGSPEDEQTHISDLHIWSIGPNIHAAIVALVSHSPESPDIYLQRIQARCPSLVHITVEPQLSH